MSKSRQASAQRLQSSGDSKPQILSPPNLPKKPSSPTKSAADLPTISERVKPILDFQDMAPAPSQSFYQIALYPYKSSESRRQKKLSSARSISPLSKSLPELTHEKLARGCVIIREWPRKRFSQGWSRESAVNPSEIVLELEDFVKGEMASHITSIFGVQRYDQLVKAAGQEVLIKKRD